MAKKTAAQPEPIKNRIIKYDVKKADQFLANPKNPRIHPPLQRDAMDEALHKAGFVMPVVETRDGYLLDGHERIYQALINNDDVPYVVVDIHSDEADADYVLATLDALGDLATYDAAMLDVLLQDIDAGEGAVSKLLNDLWDNYAGEIPEVNAGEVKLPDEKLDIYLNASIKQVVLLFTNEQYDNVVARMEVARAQAGVESNTQLFLRMLEVYEQATGATTRA